MTGALATIDGNKLACTGVGLSCDVSIDLRAAPLTEDEFAGVISRYYTLFREEIAADVAFLRGVENHQAVTKFDSAVYQLRTATQHSDNQEAAAFYAEWVGSAPDWEAAALELTSQFIAALDELARISGLVRRDLKLAMSWRARASAEIHAVFDAVCSDLRATFNPQRRTALIANVRRRAKNLRPGDDYQAAVEAMSAEEITNQVKRLPVPYQAVLDRLGLLGKSQARAALLLAYSISASTNLRGAEFLTRVDESWKIATA
jgi:hypothetical protein